MRKALLNSAVTVPQFGNADGQSLFSVQAVHVPALHTLAVGEVALGAGQSALVWQRMPLPMG